MQPGLEGLHDIVLPAPPGFWPPTPAWYVLGAVLGALGVVGLYALARHRRRNRYRRLALEHLSDIEARVAGSELPALVKRTALGFCPRVEIASLSGEDWLRFLDESYGGNGFTAGPGRLLPVLAYGRAEDVDASELDAVIELVRRWIRRHRARV